MKKFFNDNMWWMVIIAIAVGGFALYKVLKQNNEETVELTEKVTEA